MHESSPIQVEDLEPPKHKARINGKKAGRQDATDLNAGKGPEISKIDSETLFIIINFCRGQRSGSVHYCNENDDVFTERNISRTLCRI